MRQWRPRTGEPAQLVTGEGNYRLRRFFALHCLHRGRPPVPYFLNFRLMLSPREQSVLL